LLAGQKNLEREIEQLKTKLAHQQMDRFEARTLNGAKVLSEKVEGLDRAQLRTVVDALRNKWGSAVIVIASVNDSEISIVSAVSKDLVSKVQAGKLAGDVAKAVGGKGGGRADMAEGAGKDVAQLPAALASVYEKVGALL
jgi:alanyl-tRNA synthetase